MTDEKTGYKILGYFAVVIIVVCCLFHGCGKSSTINQLQSDTDSTVGNLKANSAIAGVGVVRIERTSREIGEAIEGAVGRIDRSQSRASEISGGIAEIKRRVAECQRLARQSSEIINRADAPN